MSKQMTRAGASTAGDLWTTTYVLMGLRYPRDVVDQALQGVMTGMRESATYQAILQEGEAKGEVKGRRATLLRQGRKKFGPPDAATLAVLETIGDIARLEQLSERLLEVNSWQELLA